MLFRSAIVGEGWLAEGVSEGGGDFVMKVCSLSNKWSRRRWLDSDVAVYRLPRLIERRVGSRDVLPTPHVLGSESLEYTSCARKSAAALIQPFTRYTTDVTAEFRNFAHLCTHSHDRHLFLSTCVCHGNRNGPSAFPESDIQLSSICDHAKGQ